MAKESKTAVLTALAANFAIASGKLVAGVITGSAALLAEAGHSLADTANQVFLLVGINLSTTVADEAHPHGYGKEAFFWSFLAAIFIFVAGATFAFYEGGRTLIQENGHDRSTTELIIAFAVLGMAFLFESISFTVALRSLLAGARHKRWSLFRYVQHSPDLTTKTVFYEDGAALTGLLFATAGLALSEAAGSEAWDAIASLGIGCILAAVSVLLGLQARNLLLGAAAGPEIRQAIRDTVASFPEVEYIVRILSMQLGAHSVLVTGELHVRRGLDTEQIEELLERIDARLAETVPDVTDTFWELRRAPRLTASAGGAVE